MTERIDRFLAVSQPATPCLVVDLDVVRQSYETLQRLLPLRGLAVATAPDVGALPVDDDALATIDVPALVVHCEDDQIVPLAATAPRTASMLGDATLKIYPGGSHGLIGEFEAQFNHDLLNFIKA